MDFSSNLFSRLLNKTKSSKVLPLFLIPIPLAMLTGGCETDDLGLCTIKMSGDDLVYEEISIEECQNIFGDTVGAGGWSWDPQD